ncbi:LysR family transcriptional regulator [Rhodococcus sp. 5G237]
MEIRHIEYFLAIVDQGNVVAAARELDIAQPTVSQAIRALERELGTSLFHRAERGLTPTPAGRALIGPGRRLVRNALSWPDTLASSPDDLHGRLDIAVFPPLADSVLEVFAQFCERYPHVELRLSDMHDDQPWATDIIRNGRVDAMVMHLPAPDDNLAVLPLGEQQYVAVYPPGTELPPGPVDLAALPDHPMVFVPEAHTLTRDVAKRMRSRGVRPRVAALTEHRETLIPLVAAGLGGAIVDHRMVDSENDLVVRPIHPPVIRRFGVVYDEARLAPVAEAFLEVVRGTASAADRDLVTAEGASCPGPDRQRGSQPEHIVPIPGR